MLERNQIGEGFRVVSYVITFVVIYHWLTPITQHGKLREKYVVVSPQISWKLGILDQMRNQIEHCLQKYPPNVSTLMRSMLFGTDYKRDGSFVYNFKSLGLLHLFSVSGLHVHFAYVGLLGIVQLLGLLLWMAFYNSGLWQSFTHRSLLVYAPLLGVFVYVILCGFRPPSQRAFLTIMIAKTIKKSSSSFPTLFTLLIVAALQVYLLRIEATGLSFQLSWCATICVLGHRWPRESRPFRILRATLLLQIKLLIVSGFLLFHWVPIGLLANVIFLPIAPIIYLFCWVGLIFGSLDVAHTFLTVFFSSLLSFLEGFAEVGELLNRSRFWSDFKPLIISFDLARIISCFILLNSLRNMAKRKDR